MVWVPLILLLVFFILIGNSGIKLFPANVGLSGTVCSTSLSILKSTAHYEGFGTISIKIYINKILVFVLLVTFMGQI